MMWGVMVRWGGITGSVRSFSHSNKQGYSHLSLRVVSTMVVWNLVASTGPAFPQLRADAQLAGVHSVQYRAPQTWRGCAETGEWVPLSKRCYVPHTISVEGEAQQHSTVPQRLVWCTVPYAVPSVEARSAGCRVLRHCCCIALFRCALLLMYVGSARFLKGHHSTGTALHWLKNCLSIV